MPRRMSCSLTIDAVRLRQKVVTRRHVDTWKTLKPGDRLTLIEKGMGLPKGAKQVVLAEVEIVDVRVEPITTIITEPDGTAREGLPTIRGREFVRWWCVSHGYRSALASTDPFNDLMIFVPECRRIEWRYLT